MLREKITYAEMNSRQKENFNFHKIAASLSDYGYASIRLSDDFNGADFLAVHVNGQSILRVQLKGRFCFDEKYYGKNIYIAFRDTDDCYIYPHDEVRRQIEDAGMLQESKSENWILNGSRSWPNVPKKFRNFLEKYKL